MKSVITAGILVTSLTLTGSAAMAATAQPHKAVTAAHVARPQVPRAVAYGAWPNSSPQGAWPDVRVGQAPDAAWPGAQVAARGYAPGGRLGADIGQFIQGMLAGGPVSYANLIRDARRMPASSGSYDFSSPTYDNTPAVAASGSYDFSSPTYDNTPAVAASSAADESLAASEAENQAIQQMNDTNAMTASMAAAEAENDEANAATLQTEINAGM